MNRIELIAPCHFGLEAVLKREILDLGYEISSVEDGRVTFQGDAEAVCRANIFLRTAERVLLKVGSFQAVSFEELFEKTKALPWERVPCVREREESCRKKWRRQINTYLSMWEIFTVLLRKTFGMQTQLKLRSVRARSLEWEDTFQVRK